MARLSAYGLALQRQREQEMIARHEDAVVRRLAQQYAEIRDFWLDVVGDKIWCSMRNTAHGGRPDLEMNAWHTRFVPDTDRDCWRRLVGKGTP